MDHAHVCLKSDKLEVRICLPGEYSRSRYDHSGMVEQVRLGENQFLSREKIGEGDGLGGIGLAFCLEWNQTELYDGTAIADYFPMLGVGLLRKTDSAPFLFTRDYPVVPFEHQIHTAPDRLEVISLPHLCKGVAVEQKRIFAVDGNMLSITCELTNCGPACISGTEFCHNFFCFNERPIDSHYRLSFPYSVIPRMRRGQILLERDALRLGEFDCPTASTAFWLNGYEGMSTHWMKLENSETRTGVLVEDCFPVSRIYSWNNKDALCPETFKGFSLEPGQTDSWTRKYTFYSISDQVS